MCNEKCFNETKHHFFMLQISVAKKTLYNKSKNLLKLYRVLSLK